MDGHVGRVGRWSAVVAALVAVVVAAVAAPGGAVPAPGRAEISGTVVVDGTLVGIADVRVTLSGADVQGVPVLVETTTDASGAWVFTDVPPGTYAVTETQPAGYLDGPDRAGPGGGTVGNDVISGIGLDRDEVATGYEFRDVGASVAGAVFVDRDGDGEPSIGDATFPGTEMRLTGTSAGGAAVDIRWITDDDGRFLLDGAPAGEYDLTEVQPAGVGDGPDTPGTAGGTSVAPDTITGITLDAGEDATGYLFTEVEGAVTGTVFVDTDTDGTLDVDEDGRLADVEIALVVRGDATFRTTTAADGTYTIPWMVEGPYTVRQTQPDGYGSTTPDEVEVVLGPGEGATVDFGEARGAIGDRVFADADGDGIQDPDEEGVEGVAITLYDETDAEAGATTSDATGRYLFGDLPAGTYTVGVETGPDRLLSPAGRGDDRTTDSDVDPTTGRSGPITIARFDDGHFTFDADTDAGLIDRVDDLAVSLTVAPTTVTVGGQVDITAQVANEGTAVAPGAQLVVTVPEGFSLVAPPAGDPAGLAAGDWSCGVQGQVATCSTTGALQPGTSTPPVTVKANALEPAEDAAIEAVVSILGEIADDDPLDDVAIALVDVIDGPVAPTPNGLTPTGGGGGGGGLGAAGIGTTGTSLGDLATTGVPLVTTVLVGVGLVVGGFLLQRRTSRRPERLRRPG